MMLEIFKETKLPTFTTSMVTAPDAVASRLAELFVELPQVITIGQTARSYADDAGPHMPLNAAGML